MGKSLLLYWRKRVKGGKGIRLTSESEMTRLGWLAVYRLLRNIQGQETFRFPQQLQIRNNFYTYKPVWRRTLKLSPLGLIGIRTGFPPCL